MPSENDALQMARDELGAAMVPAPDDLLADVGPLGQVYFLNQAADHVVRSIVGMMSGPEAEVLDDDSGPVRALAACTIALGNIGAACVALSIFDNA